MSDAFLLLSFGGPEGPDDVMPFLRNVTRGRGVPDERLAAVAEHYRHVGGVSPINGQNRELKSAISRDFAAHGLDLPVYWGNRNWHPLLEDTVATMAADGITRAFVFATAATGSYSGCRQYREDLARSATAVPDAPEFVKLRHFFDHPGFITANVDAITAARSSLPATLRAEARLVCTAHSIPTAMNSASGCGQQAWREVERGPDEGLYEAQHLATASLVANGAGFDTLRFAWQSRSGPPQVPWLEPAPETVLRKLAKDGVEAVVVAPTGFVSDHMEVVYDLDIELRAVAEELGLTLARAATAGTHPAFVAMVRELVLEARDGAGPKGMSELGLCGVVCPDYCCPAR